MFNTKIDKIDSLSTLNFLLSATVVQQYTLMVHTILIILYINTS